MQTLPHKRFQGTVFQPPFIVLRRTSRPDDIERAVGTIVLGDEPAVVENHLLVIRPHDCTQETCSRILTMLKDERTSQWLNGRIRCRHLTVSAINEIPWWSENDG